MRYQREWGAARLRATRDLTADIRLFEIVPQGGVRPFAPGAHIEIAVTVDGRPDSRCYSLVGEGDGECYRIAVRRAPDSRGGSAYLWSLASGARLQVSRPQSLFEVDLEAPETLLIAGGIGITPITGMAALLVKRLRPFRLAYCGRRRSEMAFVGELADRLGDRLEVFESAAGERFDAAAAIADLSPDAAVAICGPMRLLDDVRRAWAEQGRDPARLRYETFGSSGRFAPEPFRVRVPRLGVEVTVPESRTLLDALTEAGVDLLWDCRRGECGLCAVDVLDAETPVDHRDVFFSEAEKAENRRLCACVSRAVGGTLTIDTAYRGD